MIVFLSDYFKKYCENNNIEDVVKQYQLSIRVLRRIYSMVGDNIFSIPEDKMKNIVKETLDYYNKVDKIISEIPLFTNKTAIFSLHNNERNSDGKTFRFTPVGIKEILKKFEIEPEIFETIEVSFIDQLLDFINENKQDEISKQSLLDFVNNFGGSINAKKDILEYLSNKEEDMISKKTLNRYFDKLQTTRYFQEAIQFLKFITRFNDYGQERGVFIFDGHGADDGVFYSKGNKLTVNQISRALILAQENGVNLENLTLMFLSCHSYKFADNIIKELMNNGITVLPQIITDAGKETIYGYTAAIDLESGERIKVSNLFYSLMKFFDSKTDEQLKQIKGKLTFKDLADTPRYLSNNTLFVTNKQIEELNHELEGKIRTIISDFSSEDYIRSYNPYAELKLPSTTEKLNKIGNNKIIKKLYKDKAGENFRYTNLGVALGTIIELFSFWSPNFVKAHNFDSSIKTKMVAVVWVIRALSIGLGVGVGTLFAVVFNPFAVVVTIPAIFLTEIISHYIWNIKSLNKMLESEGTKTTDTEENISEVTESEESKETIDTEENIPEISELKKSIRPIDVAEEVRKTGLSQEFIDMVNRYSADKGFISVYDAYKQGRQKNNIRRKLNGREYITINNGYALGLSSYYIGNGNMLESVRAVSDSTYGINLCTYTNGYYEFGLKMGQIPNGIYLQMIFDDCEKNNKEIYFFLPPNINSFSEQELRKIQTEYIKKHPENMSYLATKPFFTKTEVKWLKNHPQYMKYVHFVVGSYTFLDKKFEPDVFDKYFGIENISKNLSVLLSDPKKYTKEASINYYREYINTIVLLIGKEDGTKFSVTFLVKRGGVADVFLSSINDSSVFNFEKKQIDEALKEIEEVLGVKINIDEKNNRIEATSRVPRVTLDFVNNEDTSKILSSLKKVPLTISEQQKKETELLVKESGSKGAEYIYLDRSGEDINKIKEFIENDKLMVLYPLSNVYDIDSLTDEQLYALYNKIANNFFDMTDLLRSKKISNLTIEDINNMAFALKELVKNAFVHGNFSDPSKPIYVKCSKKGIKVYNFVNEDIIDEEIKTRRLYLSTAARLTGEHRGLAEIEKDGIVDVTPEQSREIVIDGNKVYSISTVIISGKQRKRTANDLMIIRDIASSVFALQKAAYSTQEYKGIISKILGNHQEFVMREEIFAHNIIDFISKNLDEVFFINPLINQIFGIRDMTKVLSDKKLLITASKQQEENLNSVLKNNAVEDIKIVTMEIINEPVVDIRSDMTLDVQKGIKARYDNKENKIIVYSKKGIDISNEEIEELIMQSYFDERNEDIIDNDVIAFADKTDKTLTDITNRLKTAYTASVTMPNKETKFDLSLKQISNIVTVCKQEFVSTGIRTFVVTQEQAEKFATEIQSLQKQDFKFVISCKADVIADTTNFDGLVIDAVSVSDINQATKLMETVKKQVFIQGVAKQVTIKFSRDIYKEFSGTDIFNKYGIIPVVNADNTNNMNIGKYEVENVTENNIDNILRSNNVIGLVIDNARVFTDRRSILKEIFSKEHKYNKGYNASLSSKFDYTCYDVSKLAELLNVDINNEEDLNKLKNIDLLSLNLSSDSLTYLEYLNKKENYEEMAGFIRGIAMNSARVQIINGLKSKEIELDVDKFAKQADGKYQKAFLTVAVQLMTENIDITDYLETDFINSDMTTKQYLDSIYEKVNINIEDILKQNEYKIQRTENTAKAIEDFKNYVVLLDNLKVVKEATADFDMSMKAVRSILSAA
ncbi:MAG: hypothetical protein K5622_02380 [Endomicrobiaceae bacterium]|nr:hypothetical protein [Endomicrobiaceae bacterium]